MELPAMRNASEGNSVHRIYAEERIFGKDIEPFSCNPMPGCSSQRFTLTRIRCNSSPRDERTRH